MPKKASTGEREVLATISEVLALGLTINVYLRDETGESIVLKFAKEDEKKLARLMKWVEATTEEEPLTREQKSKMMGKQIRVKWNGEKVLKVSHAEKSEYFEWKK